MSSVMLRLPNNKPMYHLCLYCFHNNRNSLFRYKQIALNCLKRLVFSKFNQSDILYYISFIYRSNSPILTYKKVLLSFHSTTLLILKLFQNQINTGLQSLASILHSIHDSKANNKTQTKSRVATEIIV